MALSPRFNALAVADVTRETEDAISVAFAVPGALRPDYAFTAGQYLTLRRQADGQEIRRAYSICTAPDDQELRIAIKRVDAGLFSTWAHSSLQRGDVIDVMTPTGRFGQLPPSAAPRTLALFAAGSGITPILSLARHHLAATNDRLFLFYGNRSTAQMLFREALEDLKDRHMSRFAVFHVLSQEQQDIPLLNGRLDGDKVRLLLRHLLPAPMIDHAFLCGPAAMSEALEAALLDLALQPNQIHIERFTSIHDGKPRSAPPRVRHQEAPRTLATIIHDGRTETVPVAEGETVIDAALRAGLDLPYSCKGGMCSTCRARILDGAATMDLNFSLEPWELDAGYILTCQARPTTPRLTLDYDQV